MSTLSHTKKEKEIEEKKIYMYGLSHTQEEKETNALPVVKNMANKNKVVHPRNPLSYPYIRHRLIIEWQHGTD